MRILAAGSVVHVVAATASLRARAVSIVERAAGCARVHPCLQDYLDHVADLRDAAEDSGRCLLIQVDEAGAGGLEPLWCSDVSHPVIVIARACDVETAVRVMQDGAFDCVESPMNDAEILDAVIAAAECDVEHRRQVRRHAELKNRAATLTLRERQVMSLLVAGALNKTIAARLGLSRRTVEVHRIHVMQKMNATSLAHLINMSLSLAQLDKSGKRHAAHPGTALI